MNKLYVYIGLVAAVLVGGFFLFGGSNTSGYATVNVAQPVNTVSLVAVQGGFEPSEFTVKVNVPVKITLTASSIAPDFDAHGFSINEFNVNEAVMLGETNKFEFTPTKTGSFVYYCSVFCGKGHVGQAGIMHVVE